MDRFKYKKIQNQFFLLDETEKMKLIYQWVKTGYINYKEFEVLIKNLNQ